MKTVFILTDNKDHCFGIFATKEGAENFLQTAEEKEGWMHYEVVEIIIEEWPVRD